MVMKLANGQTSNWSTSSGRLRRFLAKIEIKNTLCCSSPSKLGFTTKKGGGKALMLIEPLWPLRVKYSCEKCKSQIITKSTFSDGKQFS